MLNNLRLINAKFYTIITSLANQYYFATCFYKYVPNKAYHFIKSKIIKNT